MSKKSHSKVKQTIIAVVIALITVFFLAYLVETVYPAPEYSDYCDDIRFIKAIETESECETMNGRWVDSPIAATGGAKTFPAGEVPEDAGYCDLYYNCNLEFEAAKEPYERNLFIFNIIVGLVILIGAFFLGIEAISTGFMGAGAINMIYGTLRYWGSLSNVWRTVILGIALIVIVYFSYRKLRD